MLIGYEELKKHFGGTTTEQVAANLAKAGVRYFPGKRGKPFTTETALNAALGVNYAGLPKGFSANDDDHSEIEVL